jgi:molybdate transport system substrate-binding protein
MTLPTLRVLSAASIRTGVSAVAALQAAEGVVQADLQFTSAPKVRARVLDGEQADVVIASTAALDVLEQAGKLVAATRTTVGSTGMGVAVRTGASVPDLSTEAALRSALAAADTLLHNEGSSGLNAVRIIDELGLRAPLGARIRVCASGVELFELLGALHGTVYALANVTNIRDQVAAGLPVALAVHLPASLRTSTTYEVVAAAGATDPARAAAFAAAFATPEARSRLAEAGVT